MKVGMKKSRVAVGLVLATGLGLSGMAGATASSAATPGPAGQQQAAKGHQGHKGDEPVIICLVTKHGVPGKPIKGKVRITVKVVNGKVYVYINGKRVPGKGIGIGKECLKLPGKGHGKGVICIIEKGPGKAGTAGTVNVQGPQRIIRGANGLDYIEGKPGPAHGGKDKFPGCPLPKLPGKGGTGTVNKGGHEAGTVSVQEHGVATGVRTAGV